MEFKRLLSALSIVRQRIASAYPETAVSINDQVAGCVLAEISFTENRSRYLIRVAFFFNGAVDGKAAGTLQRNTEMVHRLSRDGTEDGSESRGYVGCRNDSNGQLTHVGGIQFLVRAMAAAMMTTEEKIRTFEEFERSLLGELEPFLQVQ